MKPKPFSGLNHFTVPVATGDSLPPRPGRAWCALRCPPASGAGAPVRELLPVQYCDAEPSAGNCTRPPAHVPSRTATLEGMARHFASAVALFAHPDDAEFMCGGTIAGWCASGTEVHYVVITDGSA